MTSSLFKTTAILSCDSDRDNSVPSNPSYFLCTISRSIINPSASSPIATETPPAPKSFFQNITDIHKRARNISKDSEKRYYTIGQYTICLSFANSALISGITPAFEHLRTAPVATPDFTVLIWDSVSTGITMIKSPWNIKDYLTHGKIRGYNSRKFQTSVSLVSGALSMLDIENNIAAWWIKDYRALPMIETGSPIIAILDWWTSRNNLHYLHAGAVGTKEGGVLLMGTGGSGKSTTSIGCLNTSLYYLADDYCLLNYMTNPYVYSIYNSGKLDEASAKKLAHLNLSFFNKNPQNNEKYLTFIYNNYPKFIIKGFPIKAVLLPKISAQLHSSLKKISASETFKMIAPNNLLQFTGKKDKTLQALVKLVNSVPCYQFSVGSDIVSTHRRIKEVI